MAGLTQPSGSFWDVLGLELFSMKKPPSTCLSCLQTRFTLGMLCASLLAEEGMDSTEGARQSREQPACTVQLGPGYSAHCSRAGTVRSKTGTEQDGSFANLGH